ncbi:hypothetical protein [Lapidilactobacillus wuchangensis]|uniref:hypothetical protein n=1 Tax=Lapidilactobacillus wuchangensis TaxID=2486001 RepID=UPI000F79F74D|nr:hypothetical protein [Lapidilactobacillus wuchangensis]
MRRRGLLIMSLGFIVIMSSPASAGATNIRTGLLVLGLTIVIVGFIFYRKDKKAYEQTEATQKAKEANKVAPSTRDNDDQNQEKVIKK